MELFQKSKFSREEGLEKAKAIIHVDRRGHEEFDAATEGMDVDFLILSDHSLAQVQPDAAAECVEPGAVLSASAEPLRVRLSSCFITEVVLRYIVRMPRSYERGINYIISRNLRFQLINTPLVALLICLYRHFVMSSLVEINRLSLSNYLETLAIIAFLSFAIGLYWRFKFRSKYLAMELEEPRLLNEELKEMQAKSLLSMSSDSPAVDTKVYSEVNEQNNSPVDEVEELIEKLPH